MSRDRKPGQLYEALKIERLRKSTNLPTLTKGIELFRNDSVEVQHIGHREAQCTVHDKHPYPVQLKVTTKYLYLKCGCLYGGRGKICAHEIAACMAVRQELQKQLPAEWVRKVNEIYSAAIQSESTQPARYLLLFSLQGNSDVSPFFPWRVVPFKISLNSLPRDTQRTLQNSPDLDNFDFLASLPDPDKHLRQYFGKLDPRGCINCNHNAVLLANVLHEEHRSYPHHSQQLSLSEKLEILSDNDCPLFSGDLNKPLKKRIAILKAAGSIELEMRFIDENLFLTPMIIVGQLEKDSQSERNAAVVSTDPLWLLRDNQLFNISNPAQAALFYSFQDEGHIEIPANAVVKFQNTQFSRLASAVPLIGEFITRDEIRADPVPRLYLSDIDEGIQTELRFAYSGYEVEHSNRVENTTILHVPDTWKLIKIHRKEELEYRFYEQLITPRYGLKRTPRAKKPGYLSLRAHINPVDFLLNYVPRLLKDGIEIFGEEELTNARVNRTPPKISFEVSSGIDWFDIKGVVNFGDLQVDLADIKRQLRQKRRYIKLSDGSIGEIPKIWIERYRQLFGLGEVSDDNIRLARHHLTFIDHLIDGSDSIQTDQQFADQRDRLRNFTGIQSHPVPSGFVGELRPYQKAGFDWLLFLDEFRFGGCLADDMGLGKTIQALAFLLSLKESDLVSSASGKEDGQKTGLFNATLIVVPRSLLVNWQREAARFAPQLSIYPYIDADRAEDLTEFDKFDLVLTTYGIMRRDIKFLSNYRFHYIILDESQAIKNPAAKTAKAARMLQAHNRLSLTGTPVENTTLELWSLYAFLNPGLLGNLSYFKREFINPIEKQGDQRKVESLRNIIHPFILRRTKNQVAPELPPRTERIVYSDMEPAQRKLYLRTRDYYRGLLLGMIEEGGMLDSRMKILEGLLRLRQISNHPRLFDVNFRGESGKFNLLEDTLKTLRAEGHKVLVFSQFVQMLQLVRRSLDQQQVHYEYLDGSTTKRQLRVDNFQNNPQIPFFLISLKAGGIGLNLTAADYVIHIDPWWNPSVERQASDRTHRIGQDKPVFVYKLITRDTVEEKVLLLQNRKTELVNQLITTDASFFKSLSVEEVELLFSD